MELYEKLRSVPDEAKKQILAGRLKGMSDVNPMWRIKRLTEVFGTCGCGWWYEITDKHIIYDEITNQKAAFVDILLYYVDPVSGETSRGIPGTGGASFVSQESKGAYLSDECFKMALTDAISVAGKAIGLGADVYYQADKTKYTKPETDCNPKEPKKAEKPPMTEPVRCPICDKEVKKTRSKGVTYEPIDILKRLGGMCPECYKEHESKAE